MDCFSLYELVRARQPWADARTQGAAVPVPGPLRLLYKRSGLSSSPVRSTKAGASLAEPANPISGLTGPKGRRASKVTN